MLRMKYDPETDIISIRGTRSELQMIGEVLNHALAEPASKGAGMGNVIDCASGEIKTVVVRCEDIMQNPLLLKAEPCAEK